MLKVDDAKCCGTHFSIAEWLVEINSNGRAEGRPGTSVH